MWNVPYFVDFCGNYPDSYDYAYVVIHLSYRQEEKQNVHWHTLYCVELYGKHPYHVVVIMNASYKWWKKMQHSDLVCVELCGSLTVSYLFQEMLTYFYV
ncbi:hypothetical protein FKM82_019438 [Ascaphus truei]